MRMNRNYVTRINIGRAAIVKMIGLISDRLLLMNLIASRVWRMI